MTPPSPAPPRRIAVLTTSRADWSHLVHPMRALHAAPDFEPSLLVAGAHLSSEFGTTASAVRADGFDPDREIECLLSSDTDVGMAKTIGVATLALADALGADRPDALFVVADRYEMLALAAVGLALRIPMIHLEGGDVSEGAIDDAVRNALTKMAHVHLTPTESARRRVIAMGEEPWRVTRVGAPSLDHLRAAPLPDRASLEARLGHPLSPAPIVVAFHSRTLGQDPTDEGPALFAALETRTEPLVFVFPNADAGSRALLGRARELFTRRAARSPAPPRDALHRNLAPPDWFGLLSHAAALVGNSSSGIMEAASLPVPVVDVGDRQAGRERARHALHTEAQTDAITSAIDRAVSDDFRRQIQGVENPYGDGRASARIVEALRAMPDRERLLHKRTPGLPLPTGSARSPRPSPASSS